MAYETVRYKEDGPRATITLNRPGVLNAINGRMLEEFQGSLKKSLENREVRVVVLDSASPRAFSSGIDVAFVRGMNPLGARRMGRLLHETFWAFRTFPKPVVAAIDGLCLGAGLELAISCDILVASDRSEFGLPNINVGIPAIVEAAILPQAIGIFGAKELAFTGENWGSRKALARGLVNSVVPRKRLKAEVDVWVQKLASKSPRALELQKEIIHHWMTSDIESAIDFSINTVVLSWFTKDQKEGMGAFLEKRKARFRGE